MKKIFLNITVWFVIAQMIFAVVGVQLHYHTCGKTGSHTYKMIEDASCSCEEEAAKPVEVKSCCQNEIAENDNCSTDSENIINNNQAVFDKMDCCSDKLMNISLNEVFVTSSYKIFLNAIVKFEHDFYNLSKIRLDEYKSKLTEAKTLFKIPHNIILEIIKISQSSGSKDYSHLLH